MPGLGLLAFHEQGGDLKKVALVPQPKEAAVECAAILLDGFDVIVLGLSSAAVTPSRGRAVAARAGEARDPFLLSQKGNGTARICGSGVDRRFVSSSSQGPPWSVYGTNIPFAPCARTVTGWLVVTGRPGRIAAYRSMFSSSMWSTFE